MAADNEEDYYDNDDEIIDSDDQNEVEDDGDAVEIYSKTAIWGFTIFFSTVFGGVLLFQNLKNAGYKKAAGTVLLFSIAYTALSIVVAGYLNVGRFSGLIFNLIGGYILTEYFFKRYFPDDDYYPKPIWKALAISVIIALAISLLVLYMPGVREKMETK